MCLKGPNPADKLFPDPRSKVAILPSYLDKHLAHGGAGLVGSAVDRHGLAVPGEFQGELLLHQLLDDLRPRQTGIS